MSSLDDVRAKIQSSASNETRIVESLFKNPIAWGMYYAPHHFRSNSPPFHLKLIKEAVNNRFLAVQAPRESAKSTMLNFLYTTHGICHKRFRFVVIVQNTFKKAAGSLDTIKQELKENKKIRKDYKIKIIKDAEGDSIFEHPDGFKTRVLCKGAEQIGSIRGEKFGAYRPDLILGDDMEDDEMVRSPDRRKQFQEEFDEALIPAGDRQECQYIFIGTILHDDCTIAKLVSRDHYPKYRKLFYVARYENPLNGELKSLWEEKWTVQDLNEMEKDNPKKFAKEYQGDPSSGLMAKFSKSDFRRWAIENMNYVLYDDNENVIGKGSLRDCRGAIACDLAWEEKRESDFSVIMPGFLTPQSDLLVDTYHFSKGLRPNKMEEIIFSMEERLKSITGKSVPIGFEKAKLEKVAKWFLKQAMQRRNRPLYIKDLQWGTDKIERIISKLEPRYNQHMVYHQKGMGDLEYQLIKFPNAAHDDLPDALQGLVQLLQVAPSVKTVVNTTEDEGFEWLLAQQRKKMQKKPFVFGKKTTLRGIPAKQTWK